jgi:hypothetical protein
MKKESSTAAAWRQGFADLDGNITGSEHLTSELSKAMKNVCSCLVLYDSPKALARPASA